MGADIHWERTDLNGPETKCLRCDGSGKQKCYACKCTTQECNECSGVGTIPKAHSLSRQVLYFLKEKFPQLDGSGTYIADEKDLPYLKGACDASSIDALKGGLREIIAAIETHGSILLCVTY